MAGHSKWHNIQHRKAGQDARRGKIFTKLIREITIAARTGGPESDTNPRLRAAIDKALSNNMTKDTISRAVKRGSGDDDGEQMMEIRYEGYGPAGVAVIVDCLTDNKNRTVAEVRHAFSKCGGNLGTSGSVAYLFNKVGLLSFEDNKAEDKILEIALEAGADDVVVNEDHSIDVLTTPENFMPVKDQLVAASLLPQHADITLLPSTEVKIDREEEAMQLVRLTDMLEDLDDVQQVHNNAQIAADILAKL